MAFEGGCEVDSCCVRLGLSDYLRVKLVEKLEEEEEKMLRAHG